MNLDTYDQPNILFLRGCFVKDCNSVEDMFDERIIDESINENKMYNNIHVIYDDIPPVFTSLETWPKNTNIKCWSCSCSFYGPPIFIPGDFAASKSPGEVCDGIDVIGNFCSWGCSSRWIDMHYTGNCKWEKKEMLKLLYKMMNGETINEIISSPCKTIMKQYGGSVKECDYKKLVINLSMDYISLMEHNETKNITML